MTRAINVTTELPYLRTDGQASALKLAFPASNIVFTARINQPVFTTFDSVVEIIWDRPAGPSYVGAYGDILSGMTLWVGTNILLRDVGIARVRGSADGTKIYIGETSDLALADNLYLTVVDEILPWAKHIKMTGDITCDMDWNIEYGVPVDQYVSMNPIANLGPDAVIYTPDSVISGGSPASVTFDASGSFMPDGLAISGYVWVVTGAGISGTGLTTATPTFSVTQTGTWRVKCTVTGNGITTVGFRTIVAYDLTHPPITQFILDQAPTASVDEGGWSFGITLYAEADIAQVQDRQQVILFARDWYGELTSVTSTVISFDAATKKILKASGLNVFKKGAVIRVSGSTYNDGIYTIATGNTATYIVINEVLRDESAGANVTVEVLFSQVEQSFGPVVGRENIVCMGWIDKDTMKYSPDGSSVTFMAYGPHYWLNKMTEFILGIEDWDGVPDESRTTDWTEFIGLTVDKGLFALLYWRSTIPFFMDVYLTGDTRPCPSIEAPEGSLWGQIQTNAWDTIFARPLCNCYGQLYIEIDPQFATLGEKATFPVVMNVAKSDCEKDKTEIGRSATPKTSRISASGVEYEFGDNGIGTAFLSFAPGHIFKGFGSPESLERLLISGQSQLNDLSGLYLAKLNNPYSDNKVTLVQNNRFIDICPRQYFHMTRAAIDNPRGILFDYDIIPTRIVRQYDNKIGFISVDIEGEAVIVTDLSVTGVIPTPTPPDIVPVVPIVFPPYIPVPWPALPSTKTYTWVIAAPITGGIPGPRLASIATVILVSAYAVDGTSVTFNIEERSVVGSAGVNLMGADLAAYAYETGVGSFTNADLAPGNWLWLDISNVAGLVSRFVVTLTVRQV